MSSSSEEISAVMKQFRCCRHSSNIIAPSRLQQRKQQGLFLMLLVVVCYCSTSFNGLVAAFSTSRSAGAAAGWATTTTTTRSAREETTTRMNQVFSKRSAQQQQQKRSPVSALSLSSSSDDNDSNNNNNNDIFTALQNDARLYSIRLPRAPGIDWGTDLSFAYVSVRDMDPTGPAAASGQVAVGDQLVQLTAINMKDATQPKPQILLGAPFDYVMTAFATLDRTVVELDLVFFRGTKQELQQAARDATGGAAGGMVEPETITVTVIERNEKETKTHSLTAKPGVNVRTLLVDNGINVYQSFTRWTNCKGKQLCGTCIVNITENNDSGTNRKSMDEASTLRENPETYRLSCITFAYRDITVETFPPINAAQWTR